MKITVTDDDNTENVNALIAGVRQFNVEHMGAETSQPLSVIAHDESGKLIAGVAGYTIYDNFLRIPISIRSCSTQSVFGKLIQGE